MRMIKMLNFVMNKICLTNTSDSDFSDLEGKVVKYIKTDGNNSGITNAALTSIAKVIGLEELDLEWATQITDEGLSSLHQLKSLKYIDLSFCDNISLKGIQELKTALPSLEIEQ